MSHNRKSNNPFYTNRIEVISLESFLSGYTTIRNRLRFKVFAKDHYTCTRCGLAATRVVRWAEIKKPSQIHVDLCGIRQDGTEVMFTMDHRIPKSQKGPTALENLDTMCEPCNHHKDDYISDIEFKRIHADLSEHGRLLFTFSDASSGWVVTIEGKENLSGVGHTPTAALMSLWLIMNPPPHNN